jgi:simple sugar transport system substrate-binding protein
MHLKLIYLLVPIVLLFSACSTSEPADPISPSAPVASTADSASDSAEKSKDIFKLGLILVGPQNDHGWSQAHYEGATYAMDKIGGQLITIDKVNPSDSPNITVPQIVDDMIEQGAQLIVATSDDMKDGIFEAAANNPEIPMVFVSGDNAWKDGEGYRSDLPMLANMMGKMEYGKMIAGCAAALQSDSGKISFLGPLINSETRRLASSTYLGANYCWNQNSISSDLDLEFKVTWIGFWFNIPGFTLDPTVVVNEFIASGSDVIISGIDTTEAIVVAGQATAGGKSIWALPYDYEGACDEAPDVCLGVPYFNWGPSYTTFSQSVIDGSFNVKFDWMEPDWNDINNHDSSAVGFLKGDGLTSSNAQLLDTFISSLADGSLNLWKGPLNYQDGSAFLTKDQIATDKEIWYLPMLLEGMEGASTTE